MTERGRRGSDGSFIPTSLPAEESATVNTSCSLCPFEQLHSLMRFFIFFAVSYSSPTVFLSSSFSLYLLPLCTGAAALAAFFVVVVALIPFVCLCSKPRSEASCCRLIRAVSSFLTTRGDSDGPGHWTAEGWGFTEPRGSEGWLTQHRTCEQEIQAGIQTTCLSESDEVLFAPFNLKKQVWWANLHRAVSRTERAV